MARASSIPLQKKTLNLRKGDFEYLDEMFEIPASVIIRSIILNYVDKLKLDVKEPSE